MRTRELPPPLPPAERTVGQLIAESIRAYGASFWRLLPLGLPLALVGLANRHANAGRQMLTLWAATPLFVVAYLIACAIVLKLAVNRTSVLVAVLIYLPFPALLSLYLLPGLAWFAFIGLAVPAAMAGGLRFREALVRGRQLGLADYVHAFGSLAALVIVVAVSALALRALLSSQGDNGQRVALFLASLVLSPLLFIGGALLYVDQAARLDSPSPERRRRDADLHPAVDADATGSPDAQVEP
jgi:hypothetical protein